MNRLQSMIEHENIEDVEFSDLMSTSYVNYAMSVIMSRAVPDVRDGLKPVQRRVIYDMNELGTFSDKPHRKSARVVGDTMGKFHPHGDSSIYEAAVVMSQKFKKNQPLVDGHGNFGSIEGDSAAAMRYTEARLENFAEDTMLSDLKYDVVDMVPNYDETAIEPEVLPCKVPHLLINGAEGIAVGMTTSIPPHNITNVIDCAIAYLKGDHDIESLVQVLKGPDFPTGGTITNSHDLLDMYKTGNGKVRIRGKMKYEPAQKSTEKDRLVVTEIPYTMIGEGINKFLIDVSKLVEDKVLPEIVDIINQSKSEDIRIVFELKPKSDIMRIKNIICKKTKFEDTIGVNMLVVDKTTPKVMNLADILQSFEEFQNQIYTRKFQKLLSQAEHQKEVKEGLIRSTDLIDVIIAVLRGSKSIAIAKKCLMSGDISDVKFKDTSFEKQAKELDFTEVQADAILAMPLSRLVGLEVDKLNSEYKKLLKEIDQYTKLLSSEKAMKKEIISYLEEAKKKYGRDRRTELADIETPDVAEIETPEVEMIVLMDRFNYLHAIDKSNYSRNKQYIDETFVHVVDIGSKDKLAVFTDIGKVHLIPMKEIPVKKPRDKGVPLDNICQFDYKQEHVVGVEALDFKKKDKNLVFVTTSGSIKMTKNSEFFINRKITDSTTLREGEEVFIVFEHNPKGQIVFETEKGLILKANQSDIKQKTKYSFGVQGIKLNEKDKLKLVTTDMTDYSDIRCGSFGTTGKVKIRKLL